MSFETILIDRFTALYGPPQTENPALYLAEWRKNFAGTRPDILTKAVDVIIRRHTFTSWPTIGEVVKAVNEVAEWSATERSYRQGALPSPYPRRPTEDQQARVQVLVDGMKRTIEAKAEEGLGTPVKLPDAGREAFTKMQRESPSRLHRIIRDPSGSNA